MESEAQMLFNNIVPAKNMELRRKMEDIGKDKPEAAQNLVIDDILGSSANHMTEEERAKSVREHAEDGFE